MGTRLSKEERLKKKWTKIKTMKSSGKRTRKIHRLSKKGWFDDIPFGEL